MKVYIIGEPFCGKTQLFSYLKAGKSNEMNIRKAASSSDRSETQGSTTSSDFQDAENGDVALLETFQNYYIPTVSFTYSVNDDYVYFDVSGSANYSTLTTTLIKTIFNKYFEGDKTAKCGILLLFDLSNRNSLKNAINIWFRLVKGGSEVVKNLQQLEHIKRCTMLVGCKADLVGPSTSVRYITEVEHRQVADRNGMQMARISCKTGEGLQAVGAFFSSLQRTYREKEWEEDARRRAVGLRVGDTLLSCVACTAVDGEREGAGEPPQPYSSAHLNNNGKYNPMNAYASRRRKEEACVSM